jgi:hypothetical protein
VVSTDKHFASTKRALVSRAPFFDWIFWMTGSLSATSFRHLVPKPNLGTR